MHPKNKAWMSIGFVVLVVLLGAILILPDRPGSQNQEYQSPQADQLKKETSTPDRIKAKKPLTTAKKELSNKVSVIDTHQQSNIKPSHQEVNKTDPSPEEPEVTELKIAESDMVEPFSQKTYSKKIAIINWYKSQDIDGDDYISVDEFLGPEPLFDRLDIDGDRQISSYEMEIFEQSVISPKKE